MKTLLLLAALAAAPHAAAADAPALAAHAGGFASAVAGRAVAVVCHDEAEWERRAAIEGFRAAGVWGYVLFRREPGGARAPHDDAQLSPQACGALAELREAPDKRAATACPAPAVLGARTAVTVVRKRVRAGGAWVVRRFRVVRTVLPPPEPPCASRVRTLMGLQTLAHESAHLRGVYDEAEAECYGTQLLDDAARWLGADEALARELALDYWRWVYLKRDSSSPYRLAACRDGSRLDLDPVSRDWPAGAPAPPRIP